jgi:tritrans,polycis-undecaprenyl-diphosphate synthase [geranylgeranyl-diphosphate specific]
VLNVLTRFFARLLESPLGVLARPIYKLYESLLWEQVRSRPPPRHVAIIPDGNRRWARQHGLNPFEGHEYGYRKLREVLEVLWKLGVKVVTVYAMSYENCIKRSVEEREHLYKLLERAIEEVVSSGELESRGIRVKFFGRLDMLPPSLVDRIREVEALTEGYSNATLNVAVCYGGREEIVQAVRRIARDVSLGRVRAEEIDEELFRAYLYTSHLGGLDEPDLVIRTSGEVRISNFLLWQIAYSELYFCDIYWPELRTIDILRAIRSYQRRERRFGA